MRFHTAMVKGIQAGSPVIQQSSLFLKNINDILKNRAFLAAGDAIFQSRWTLVREMPRYLIGSGRLRFVPTLLSKNWYAHCVGHGLLIQAAVLDRVGGFPTPSVGLEDSALGFNLRSRGIQVTPISILENGDAAESLTSLIRQKASWVSGSDRCA